MCAEDAKFFKLFEDDFFFDVEEALRFYFFEFNELFENEFYFDVANALGFYYAGGSANASDPVVRFKHELQCMHAFMWSIVKSDPKRFKQAAISVLANADSVMYTCVQAAVDRSSKRRKLSA